MSTDPREFEHPIDGTTPNELPTVLGVGSLAPQAIEVAARAINEQHEFPAPLWIALVESKDRADQNRVKRDRAYATAALTAAAPFIAAQAKAEALREAADEFRNCPDWAYRASRPMATEDYLRARAATIEAAE